MHHYESVDDEIVFGIFKNKLEEFELFEKCVLGYMNKFEKA